MNRKQIEKDYYDKQIEKVFPVDEYGFNIKISSSNGESNYIQINTEVKFNMFLKKLQKYKKQLIKNR